jgi:hypothetical protein
MAVLARVEKGFEEFCMNYAKTIFSVICWVSICQFLLVSCSSSVDAPPIDIEENYVNQQIVLRAPGHSNTFSTRDPIYLEFESNSNNEIVFPNNYNLRMFERRDGKWIPISEMPTTRWPEGDMVFSPMKKGRETTFVYPD